MGVKKYRTASHVFHKLSTGHKIVTEKSVLRDDGKESEPQSPMAPWLPG